MKTDTEKLREVITDTDEKFKTPEASALLVDIAKVFTKHAKLGMSPMVIMDLLVTFLHLSVGCMSAIIEEDSEARKEASNDE